MGYERFIDAPVEEEVPGYNNLEHAGSNSHVWPDPEPLLREKHCEFLDKRIHEQIHLPARHLQNTYDTEKYGKCFPLWGTGNSTT